MSSNNRRARKEAYFVQVENVDKVPYFVNVSSDLGKPMPFSKPLATAALRVTDSDVLFSFVKPSDKMRKSLMSGPMSLPAGALAKLERKAAGLSASVSATEAVVAIDGVEYPMSFSKDNNGIVTLESTSDVDPVIQLGHTPVQVVIAVVGVKDRRVVSSWLGYVGKPGSPDTVVRIAAQATNHMATLADFSIITGISQVKVPAPPGRFTVARPARSAGDQVRFTVPLRLWTDSNPPQPVAAGGAKVNVDLDNANPANSRLLLKIEPDKDLAPHFEQYSSVIDNAVQNAISTWLGPDETTDIVCDIALGDLGAGAIERLREAASTIRGFDANPRQAIAFPEPAQ